MTGRIIHISHTKGYGFLWTKELGEVYFSNKTKLYNVEFGSLCTGITLLATVMKGPRGFEAVALALQLKEIQPFHKWRSL